MNKKTMTIFIILALAVFISAGWNGNSLSANQNKSALEKGGHKGKVLTTMNSGGYTYIEFEENGKKRWLASKKFKVNIGDTIEFFQPALMKNFYSPSLKRKFESILFVPKIKVNGKDPWSLEGVKLPEGHVPLDKMTKKTKPAAVTVTPGSISKAEGGYTIAECLDHSKKLDGKTISIKGKVVKFKANIMGKNWAHLQDGTGKTDSNDLTITTKETVTPGSLVLVRGKITYNKDFGAGYFYKVILEQATFKTIEK
jgi:hypothetical protein